MTPLHKQSHTRMTSFPSAATYPACNNKQTWSQPLPRYSNSTWPPPNSVHMNFLPTRFTHNSLPPRPSPFSSRVRRYSSDNKVPSHTSAANMTLTPPTNHNTITTSSNWTDISMRSVTAPPPPAAKYMSSNMLSFPDSPTPANSFRPHPNSWRSWTNASSNGVAKSSASPPRSQLPF